MRKFLLMLAPLLITAGWSSTAEAQQWRPPSRQMPAMPAMGELAGDWMAPRGDWFAGTAAVSGVEPARLRPVGEARPGSDSALMVRFNNGPLPAIVWQDRNADTRADIIEIFNAGGVILQVIDADYDGNANVLRLYAPDGSLIREDRL